MGIDLALEHVLAHLWADRAWLQSAIARLETLPASESSEQERTTSG